MREFTGCKHLDFEENYSSCKRQMLGNGKLFWFRKTDHENTAMVQFCKLRGRLNSPTSCLSKETAKCSDYIEYLHKVNVSQDELDN